MIIILASLNSPPTGGGLAHSKSGPIPTFPQREGHLRTSLTAVSELLLLKMLIKELEDEECDATTADQGTEAGNTIIELTIKRTYLIKKIVRPKFPFGGTGGFTSVPGRYHLL